MACNCGPRAKALLGRVGFVTGKMAPEPHEEILKYLGKRGNVILYAADVERHHFILTAFGLIARVVLG